MEKCCRRTLALPFAFGWGASSATRIPNTCPGSSSPTTWTFTAKAPAPGTAVFDEASQSERRVDQCRQLGHAWQNVSVGLALQPFGCSCAGKDADHARQPRVGTCLQVERRIADRYGFRDPIDARTLHCVEDHERRRAAIGNFIACDGKGEIVAPIQPIKDLVREIA